MNVAVIIVNYGTAELTLEAVESVMLRNHGGRAVEIHVVDNASPGGDASLLAKVIAAHDWQDNVTLHAETENHGFGRGCNLVLKALMQRETYPNFVLLLNPDAKLQNEVIDILVRDLEKYSNAAAAGSAITLPTGESVSAAFHFPTPRRDIAEVMNFGPMLRLLRTGIRAMPPDTPAREVDWVSGAAVLFRFEPLVEVGFFDPVFFLYYEEVDLMRRLGVAGYTIRHCPQALCTHYEGAATGVRSGDKERRRRPAYLYRSWRHYFFKSEGRLPTLALALGVWISAVIGLLIAYVRGKPSRLPLFFFVDHFRFVIAPLSGLKNDSAYDADVERFYAPSKCNQRSNTR